MPLSITKTQRTPRRHLQKDDRGRVSARLTILALSALIACPFQLFSGEAKAQHAGLLASSAALMDALKQLEASAAYQEVLKSETRASLYTRDVDAIEVLKNLTQVYASLSDAKGEFKVIHGVDDDRRNYFEVGITEQKAARSTGVLVRTAEILEGDKPGFKNLSSVPAGLCPVEAFHEEPAPGFCSSVRVGKQMVATAGHCIESQADCSRTSVVFGFHMEFIGDKPEKHIPNQYVYQCRKLMHRKLDSSGADWALIEVDREIDSNVPIASLRQSDRMSNGDQITVVGYPIGLPVKITGNAIVKSQESGYFRANPDTYGGNSGSPVFNTQKLNTGKLFVEGLLVRGAKDFAQHSPCMLSHWCPSDEGCPDANGQLRFEEVTYATDFSHHVTN